MSSEEEFQPNSDDNWSDVEISEIDGTSEKSDDDESNDFPDLPVVQKKSDSSKQKSAKNSSQFQLRKTSYEFARKNVSSKVSEKAKLAPKDKVVYYPKDTPTISAIELQAQLDPRKASKLSLEDVKGLIRRLGVVQLESKKDEKMPRLCFFTQEAEENNNVKLVAYLTHVKNSTSIIRLLHSRLEKVSWDKREFTPLEDQRNPEWKPENGTLLEQTLWELTDKKMVYPFPMWSILDKPVMSKSLPESKSVLGRNKKESKSPKKRKANDGLQPITRSPKRPTKVKETPRLPHSPMETISEDSAKVVSAPKTPTVAIETPPVEQKNVSAKSVPAIAIESPKASSVSFVETPLGTLKLNVSFSFSGASA